MLHVKHCKSIVYEIKNNRYMIAKTKKVAKKRV
jgi:hypothetical protein